ncbi:MAG: CDC27 family protein [Campylobacterales bacterium]|nr:CDC27 family protein [Campylobacterales bacterium]
MHLDILETSSVTAYKDVESRFYQTHDTDDSLFLAKSYFNRGEYKKAEYWALQTNKVDNTIEESWLLFAHAKAKLGQKQDAIKVLKSYIAKTNSIEAKRLLEQIK